MLDNQTAPSQPRPENSRQMRQRLSDWWFYNIYCRWDALIVAYNEWRYER